MKTVTIPSEYHHIAPDGSEIRELLENQYAGLAHCVLPAGKTSIAAQHKTVSELWYVLSGKGQIWRSSHNNETIVDLEPGTSIDIPVGTAFQFCSTSQDDLVILITTTPPWPGADESIAAKGPWDQALLSSSRY